MPIVLSKVSDFLEMHLLIKLLKKKSVICLHSNRKLLLDFRTCWFFIEWNIKYEFYETTGHKPKFCFIGEHREAVEVLTNSVVGYTCSDKTKSALCNELCSRSLLTLVKWLQVRSYISYKYNVVTRLPWYINFYIEEA